jgi:alpha-D-xyloside xylohydrolase
MFGASIMVAPVLKSMYVSKVDGKEIESYADIKIREVYLPEGCEWYDFWTGEKLNGGQKIQKSAPIDVAPLFVKSGSILPFGPAVQYSTEKKWDKLEIRLYRGSDGQFTLYEDEFDNYNYEKNMFSTIDFCWNEKENTLSIGERKGKYQGMLTSRTFNIVLVNNSNGIGDKTSVKINRAVKYSGKALKIKF